MNIVREHINFQRSSDPRQILNIGQRARIKGWFKDVERQKGRRIDYTIDDHLNITANCNLWLENLDIDWLPDNLSVEGDLDLSDTKIAELPDNLSVGRNLYLRNTNITKLPENLSVRRNLDIRLTQITTLPLDLNVYGIIYKDF